MPIINVPADDFADIEFDEFVHEIRLRIEAERPIDIYLLDDEGYEEFEDEREFHYLAMYRRKRGIRKRLVPPDSIPWHIVIDNPYSEDVAVFYEVFVRQ